MAIQPPIVQPGDTVGVVTLGSPLESEVIDDRAEYLASMGLNVVLGTHVYDWNGFLAGSDEERANDLMEMFLDDEVDMIIPTRGGVGVAGILPYLDFNVINNNPKWVSGYSDITILLNVLYQYANIITLHSLMLIDFRATTPNYNFDAFFSVVSSDDMGGEIVNPPEGPALNGQVPGHVTGPIVGGNIVSFTGTLGTEFEIDTTGCILFLEEVNEPMNTVYRYLKQLEMAGKFDDCLGIILGQCSNCQEAYGQDYEDLIEEFFVPLGKPLITGLASGHGTYKAAVPIGATAQLNGDDGTITVMSEN
ncbi:muramoyltetrapeptide carboxypeptidase [Geomicrobium halophilum]|uniref:Muramoyltetrapeptide carboxypeptidase n=1 Tax=Geomicrobium halophilum TaxID=549000 RepID=A0A841PPR4_9BACL|nr:LD-carboxypeptidase [Geomicrobium halophilum]MBB6450760.1 muramoyltetrapeptide carboxypeptidase [Geomicrobium halophilum]